MKIQDVFISLDQKDKAESDLFFEKYFDKSNFINRLKTAIIYSGKNQREISETANITEANLSRYLNDHLDENKRPKPNRSSIEKLAEATGVSVSWLMGIPYSDIEFNNYRNIDKTSFSNGFNNRIEKIALILTRHLHLHPSKLQPYINLLKIISYLSPKGIEALVDYASNIVFSPQYYNFKSSNLRYSYDEKIDFKDYQYWKLIDINNTLKNISIDTDSELEIESIFGNRKRSLEKLEEIKKRNIAL